MFNYTLESGEDMFTLTTGQAGQLRLGVLKVRDPSLLDREVHSQVTVTVSASLDTPANQNRGNEGP